MVDQVQVDEGWSVSTTPNWRHSQWDRCQSKITDPERSSFPLYSSSLLIVRVPISLKILEDCDTNFLSVLPVMNNIVYFFWCILYYKVILCVFPEFLYVDDVLFPRELIQRVSNFLVSLWFSSPSAVICNLLWFGNKELEPSCNKVVYQNRFAIGSRIQVNACLCW